MSLANGIRCLVPLLVVWALQQSPAIAENGRKQIEGIVRQAQKEARQAVGKVKQATGNKKVYVHDYLVTIVDQGTDPEELERDLIYLVKAIEDAVDADPTIKGTGYDAKVSPMLAERAVEGDKLLLGAMLTVKTWSE